jgi:hypothetical protein
MAPTSTKEEMFAERRRLQMKLINDIDSLYGDDEMECYSKHDETVFPENFIFHVVYYGLTLVHSVIDTQGIALMGELRHARSNVYQVANLLDISIRDNLPSMLYYNRAKVQEEDHAGSPLPAVGKLAFNMMSKDDTVGFNLLDVEEVDKRCAVAYMLKSRLKMAEKLEYGAAVLKKFGSELSIYTHAEKLPSQILAETAASHNKACISAKPKRKAESLGKGSGNP